MASIISAGNATNGLAISSDNTGILQLKTGTGAGTTAVTLDASQNATFAGTVTSSTGTLYPLVSGTAVSASGTSVDFTGIPSTAKRITVMFNGVSTNGSSLIQIQIGPSSGVETSGYVGTADTWNNTPGPTAWGGTGCAIGDQIASTYSISGMMTLTNIGANAWVVQSLMGTGIIFLACAGSKSLSGVLDRLRVTTVNGTDTFDAGTINIMWE